MAIYSVAEGFTNTDSGGVTITEHERGQDADADENDSGQSQHQLP